MQCKRPLTFFLWPSLNFFSLVASAEERKAASTMASSSMPREERRIMMFEWRGCTNIIEWLDGGGAALFVAQTPF